MAFFLACDFIMLLSGHNHLYTSKPDSYSKLIQKPPEIQHGVLTSVTSVRSIPACFLVLQAADRGPAQKSEAQGRTQSLTINN